MGNVATCQTWTPFPGLHVRASDLSSGYGVEIWRRQANGEWAYTLLKPLDEPRHGACTVEPGAT